MKNYDTIETGDKKNRLNVSPKKTSQIFRSIFLFLFLIAAPYGFAQPNGPYVPDANTILLDHFDGAAGASISAYSAGSGCGSWPAASPNYAYVTGRTGFSQALALAPPVGEPDGSGTFLQYSTSDILSQANGTIEFNIYLTAYGTGLSFARQGQYYNACYGWTFGCGVDAAGQLNASAWNAFDMNSGTTIVPLNRWTHIAITWGSAGAKLYMNGALVGSSTNTGMPASGYGGYLLVPAGSNGGEQWIDELRVSNVQREYTPFAAPLVAWYPFAGSARDFSNYGNDGTNNGAVLTPDLFGNEDHAYDFDGTSSYINCGHNASFNMETALTLSAWIYPRAIGSGRIISKEYIYEMDVYNQNVRLILNNGFILTASVASFVDQWTHVLAVWDGTNAAIYINGSLANTGTYTAALDTNSADVCIGKNSQSMPAAFFNGKIDNVRMYNVALNPLAIQVLSREGNPVLAAFYPFSGNTIDSSRNGNDGTNNGATLTADRFGTANSAYYFNGTDAFIDCGNSASINNITSAITLSAWIKPDVLEGRIISKSGYNGGYELDMYNSTLRFNLNGNVYQSTDISAYLGQWIYVVGTFDGTNSLLYINAVGGSSVPTAPITADTANLTIGKASWTSQYYFKGVIDDIRILNRALRPREIDSLYYEGGWSPMDAPVLDYPLDGAANVAAFDSLRWLPVAGATKYRVQVGTSTDLTAGYTVNDTVTGTVHWIGPTTPYQQLYWHVQALNDVSASPFSIVRGFTTSSGTGASISATPDNLGFGYTTVWATSPEQAYSVFGSDLSPLAGSISVTAPAGFEISTTSGSSFSSFISVPYTGGVLSPTTMYVRFIPTELRNYGEQITHVGGGASFSVRVTGIGNSAPAIPTSVSVTPGSSEVVLRWNSNPETDISMYHITYGTYSLSTDYTAYTTGGRLDTVITISSLSNGTTYYFRVAAVDSAGMESGYSAEVFTTPSSGPGSPLSPSVVSPASRSVDVSWTNPSYPLGITALWYSFSVMPSVSYPGNSITFTAGTQSASIPVPGSLSQGYNELWIYLADSQGNKDYTTAVSVNFTYDNVPPTINIPNVINSPVYVSNSGSLMSAQPQISASASDAGSNVKEMRVIYKSYGETVWSYSGIYTGSFINNFSIPQNKFSSNGKAVSVLYLIGAWDNANNAALSPVASIEVRLGTQQMDQSPNMPAASQMSNKIAAYRMVSVPYELANPKPAALLGSLGSHMENNAPYVRWRFQQYMSGQYRDFEEISQLDIVTPGSAFFFILRDPGYLLTVQGASIVAAEKLYTGGIPLQAGWNLVGNPFTIPYPIDSLEFSPGVIRQHAFYSGSGPVGGWDTTSASVFQIPPWRGVALYVANAGTLRFPAPGERIGLTKIRPELSTASLEKETAGNWTSAVSAYRNDIGMHCDGITFGMAQGANEGDDSYDLYLPPPVGDKNVAVYFKNSDGAMMRDVRPLNDEGGVWEMKVVTGDAKANVRLSFGDRLNLPNPEFKVYLFDLDQKMAYDLNRIQTLDMNSGNGVRNFRLVVGKTEYIEKNNEGIELAPSVMTLYTNYPNPFNPETVIRYTVPNAPAAYTVTLKIFNVLGQEIAVLLQQEQQPGYYEVRWNASRYSSGIYFYQISMTNGTQTFKDIKKMVFMK